MFHLLTGTLFPLMLIYFTKSYCESEFIFYRFCGTPAVSASYSAAVWLQNKGKAIKIIERAKARSLENFLLQNNNGFPLVSIGCVEESERIIACVNVSR
jgi:hypothetical protein